MKFVSIAFAAALSVAVLLPQIANAEALDPYAAGQAMRDLSTEVHASSAWEIYREQQRCQPIDASVQTESLMELNGFDQRAIALANSISGSQHVAAMNMAFTIEQMYDALLYNVTPARCYTAS